MPNRHRWRRCDETVLSRQLGWSLCTWKITSSFYLCSHYSIWYSYWRNIQVSIYFKIRVYLGYAQGKQRCPWVGRNCYVKNDCFLVFPNYTDLIFFNYLQLIWYFFLADVNLMFIVWCLLSAWSKTEYTFGFRSAVTKIKLQLPIHW